MGDGNQKQEGGFDRLWMLGAGMRVKLMAHGH